MVKTHVLANVTLVSTFGGKQHMCGFVNMDERV